MEKKRSSNIYKSFGNGVAKRKTNQNNRSLLNLHNDGWHKTLDAKCELNWQSLRFFCFIFFATNKNRKLLIKHFWFAFFLALISLSIFYARFFLFDFLSNCSIAFMICVYVWVFFALFSRIIRNFITISSIELRHVTSLYGHERYRFRNYSETETNEHSN